MTPAIDPGAPPATLNIPEDESSSTFHVMTFGSGEMREEKLKELVKIPEWLDDFPIVWIHVSGLGQEEQIAALGNIFNIHPLVMEDVVNRGQRAKLDEYEDDLFLVLHMVVHDGHLRMEQLGLFISEKYVITFQITDRDHLEPVRERIRKSKSRIRRMKKDYLVYSLVDAVVDHYFPVLETYGDILEELEDRVIDHPDAGIMPRINEAKHDLLALRRILWPLREVINRLLGEEIDFFETSTLPFIRDCQDHITQAIDLVTTYRESCTFLSEMYLSLLSNRMNEVMRVLTVIATIFIPLTFIAGIYGMNFNSEASPFNMPELSWYWGYPAILAVMLAVALGMVLYFKTRKWL